MQALLPRRSCRMLRHCCRILLVRCRRLQAASTLVRLDVLGLLLCHSYARTVVPFVTSLALDHKRLAIKGLAANAKHLLLVGPGLLLLLSRGALVTAIIIVVVAVAVRAALGLRLGLGLRSVLRMQVIVQLLGKVAIGQLQEVAAQLQLVCLGHSDLWPPALEHRGGVGHPGVVQCEQVGDERLLRQGDGRLGYGVEEGADGAGGRPARLAAGAAEEAQAVGDGVARHLLAAAVVPVAAEFAAHHQAAVAAVAVAEARVLVLLAAGVALPHLLHARHSRRHLRQRRQRLVHAEVLAALVPGKLDPHLAGKLVCRVQRHLQVLQPPQRGPQIPPPRHQR
eukprot:m.157468 g.157468  ORF g.157468 m.157468 type:complete len:338 (-) comp17005_c3_seq3:1976-2989(-)